jgi:iron(III) transport system substrate-binding protein
MDDKIKRRVFLGTGTGALAVATAKFSGISPAFARNQEINIYSSRHYNTDRRLYDNFTRQTGIKINLVEGEADPLIERIASEGTRSPADILLTVDAGRLWRADARGLFAPVNSKILRDRIPAHLRHPKGHWFAFSQRLRVIMYAKDRVNPAEVDSYEDLAAPKWKGKVVTRSSSNIYSQSFTAWSIDTLGEAATEKWCLGFVSNFARPPQGNDKAQIEAVAAGLADLALANTYYLAGYAEEKDPAKRAIFAKVGAIFPDRTGRGTHVNISGGGLIETAPNREAAVRFLEYLSGNEAQNFFAKGNNEYPVVRGIALDPVLAKLGRGKENTANVANYGPNLARAVQVMNRAGWK